MPKGFLVMRDKISVIGSFSKGVEFASSAESEISAGAFFCCGSEAGFALQEAASNIKANSKVIFFILFRIYVNCDKTNKALQFF